MAVQAPQRRTVMADAPKKSVQIRLDADLARKCGIVASFRDVSVPEYLKSILEPIVDKDLKAEIAKEARG